MQLAGLTARTDMAVIGQDDVPHARLWKPSLTSIRMGVEEAGRALAQSLIGTSAQPS